MKKTYFKKLDGLRGISVIFVMLYHSGIENFKGGYVGVDIFFIISGYIITYTILVDQINKKFSFFQFFEKRLRRILPTLLLLILLTLLASMLILSQEDVNNLANSSIAAIFQLSNFYFYKYTSDYFSTSTEFLPLIHTWSISIEMQFYITIFFIFFIFNKKPIIIYFLIFLVIFSIFIAQLSGNLKSEYPFIEDEISLFNQGGLGSFYFPFGRFWEFGIGCLLAIFLFNKKIKIKYLFFTEYLGLTLIFYSFYFFKNVSHVPNLYLLIPMIGVILLILSSYQNTNNFSILSNKVLVQLGLISYSLFLIHQPIFVFLKFLIQYNYYFLGIYLGILISIFISYYSWKYIEVPFRSFKLVETKFFYFSISTLIILIIFISFLMKIKIIEINNYKNIYKDYNNINLSQIHHNEDISKYFQNKFNFNNKLMSRKVLVVGDSFSKGLFMALKQNQNNFKKIDFSYYDLNRDFKFFFNSKLNKTKIRDIAENKNFIMADYVLISKRYTQNDIKYLPYFLKFLKSNNKEIIITDYKQEFYGKFENPLFFILKDQRYFPNKKVYNKKEIEQILFKLLDRNSTKINKKLKKISENFEAKFIEYLDINCEIDKRKCFAFTNNGSEIYFSQNHYTLEGSNFIGKRIIKENWLNLN